MQIRKFLLRFLKDFLCGDDEYEMEASWQPDGYIIDADGYVFRPDFLALPEERRREICNGVGAAEGVSKIAPNTVYGMKIRDLADEHDYDYYLGGNLHDRLVADIVFYNNMLRRFKKGSKALWLLRRHRARLYFRALREFGYKHFGRQANPGRTVVKK